MGAVISTEQPLKILDLEPHLTFPPPLSAALNPVNPNGYEAEDEAETFLEPCGQNIAAMCSFRRRRYRSRLEARMRPRPPLPPTDPWEEEAGYMAGGDWTFWEFRRLKRNGKKGLIEWA